MTLDELRATLTRAPQYLWLTGAEASVRAEPDTVGRFFAQADRRLGREPLPDAPQWTGTRPGSFRPERSGGGRVR